MKKAFFLILVLLHWFCQAMLAGQEAVSLAPGPYPVGFELVRTEDPSRTFPAMDGAGFRARPMRIYIWYPARAAGNRPLAVGDFVKMAAGDFALSADSSRPEAMKGRLPVPLRDGLAEEAREELWRKPTMAYDSAPAAVGDFPLLVVGQGLYYESPLSLLYLCEHLASRGFVVATCPLLGTQYRLVNLNVEDLETQVRDMEFVIAALRSRPGGKARRLGVIGYDLGGHAGLVLAMRHPEVEAYLSLDCGILAPHFSGLPAAHPNYREERFTIPWMHILQARFLEAEREKAKDGMLSDRKKFGDTWLVSVPSDSHGQFSSYARFGIRTALPGYWRSVAENQEVLHDDICRLAGDFFATVWKRETRPLESLQEAGGRLFKIEWMRNEPPPASSRSLLHAICEKGLAAVRPMIDRMRTADPAARVLEESEINWLAYHFLLWWGRKDEALDLFRLNAELNPRSARALAGLGESCMILDRTAAAVAAFQKSLELDPDQPGVKAALEGLTKKQNAGDGK